MNKNQIFFFTMLLLTYNIKSGATVSQAPNSDVSLNANFQATTAFNPNSMQQAPYSAAAINNKTPEAIQNQNNTPIKFIGVNGTIGYYWDAKPTDIASLHPGRAVVGDENFINVIAVDSENTSFDPGFLNYLGNFSRLHDPIVYFLYGAYVDTRVPTPDSYETV